jgi:two-component system, LuxR family, sensor kinase FixL
VPRFAETGHLILVGIIQAGLGLVVGALLASLYRLTHRRYLQYWALAWLVLSARSVSGSIGLLFDVSQVAGRAFSLLSVFVGYLQAPALGLAASSLETDEPTPATRRVLVGGTLACATVLVGLAGLLPLPLADRIVLAVVPSYALVVAANAWFTWSFAKYSPRARTRAGRIVVGFSLLYTAHLLVVGMGWAGVDLYPDAAIPAVVGLLLPMGITSGIVLSVVQDVTGSERRLRESEAAQKALLQAIPDALFVVDRDGVFREFLPPKGFEPLVPPEQFLGRQASEFLPPELAREHKRHVALALETGETQVYEYSLPVADGVGHYEARLTPSAADRVIAIIRDVTWRKRAEADREALIAELEAKNTELERFTYTVSHDLRSPLVTIFGFLGFAEKALGKGDPEGTRRDLERVRSAATRMEHLLRDLLELSRTGRVAAPPQEVSVEDLAREVVGLLDGPIRKRGVEVRIEDGLPTVCGDPVRLREVLQNLVENATTFTASRPCPLVTIGSRGRDETGHAVLFVRDNGIGVEPAHHERVFRLFEKLDPHGEGTGVGLAIARRIVEGHGGRIWVESEGRGRGATFCFTLPERAEAVWPLGRKART